jgi:hypothetical protein
MMLSLDPRMMEQQRSFPGRKPPGKARCNGDEEELRYLILAACKQIWYPIMQVL